MNFRKFLESQVPFDKFPSIVSGVGKHYSPETFGVEIEFEAPEDDRTEEIKEKLLESDKVKELFYEKYDEIPEDPESWLEINPEPQNLDDWLEENEEPETLEDWIDEDPEPDLSEKDWLSVKQTVINTHKRWQSKRDSIESEHDNWEKDYEDTKLRYQQWQDNEDDLLNSFVNNIIKQGRWKRYITLDDPHPESISYWTNFISRAGAKVKTGDASGKTWGVGTDVEDTFIEIRTGILTKEDFPLLKTVLEKIWHDEEGMIHGGTSAHVHIGMPKDTDSFDLLAMTTLVDEDAIQGFAGANRQFEQFAKLRDSVEEFVNKRIASNKYNMPVVLGRHEFANFINGLDRYHGTNLASFAKFGTVEFRYLSSEVLQDIDGFINWINYFLVLPKIARGRKQIKVGNFVFTRLPEGKIAISQGSYRQPPESPNALRQNPEPDISPSVINFVYNKVKEMKVSDLIKKLSTGKYTLSNKILNKYWIANPDEVVNNIWNQLTKEEKETIAKEYITIKKKS